MLAEPVGVRGSHLARGERELAGVVAERPGAGVEVGFAIVVLRVGRELVWGALGTEVVGVRASSVVALVRRRDNGGQQLALLPGQARKGRT